MIYFVTIDIVWNCIQTHHKVWNWMVIDLANIGTRVKEEFQTAIQSQAECGTANKC